MDETKFLATRSTLLSKMKDLDDQESWLDFYDIYWKLIYNVAPKAGLSDADAQDVVQETILTVVRKIKEFDYDRNKGSFKGWLKVVTRSRITDHWRKQGRRADKPNRHINEDAANDPIETIPDPSGFELERIWEQEWQSNLHSMAIDHVRLKISAQQFQIFDCYVLKEWSVEDIKRKLGFSTGQIYMAKYRVGKLLKQELEILLEEEH